MLLSEMKWTEVNALSRDVPIVLPIAALEQHGHHLPVFTDSLLLGEVVRRVAERMQRDVLFVPLMWLGNSEHHLDFPGTMSASPRGYLDLLREMAENLLFHGFHRFVFLNGHGGNIIPAQQAMFELRQKYRTRQDLLLLSCTYWSLGREPVGGAGEFTQSEMGHACEWETSMILRIRPDLVGDYRVDAVPFGSGFSPAQRAWVTTDRTTPGHIGNPADASPAKGELLLTRFANDVSQFLQRVVAWDGHGWDA